MRKFLSKFRLFNFQKVLGVKKTTDFALTNEAMQRRLADMFSTPEGAEVLAWLFHSQIIQSQSFQSLTPQDIMYQAGKQDFLKYLFAITNFKFEE